MSSKEPLWVVALRVSSDRSDSDRDGFGSLDGEGIVAERSGGSRWLAHSCGPSSEMSGEGMKG